MKYLTKNVNDDGISLKDLGDLLTLQGQTENKIGENQYLVLNKAWAESDGHTENTPYIETTIEYYPFRSGDPIYDLNQGGLVILRCVMYSNIQILFLIFHR
jgi:hypothetical protein